ncbi:MAG: DUF5110 domain-containing protein [Treponema sp.]|nr:DUF5110 domain-containing protein [Treponema sp.]
MKKLFLSLFIVFLFSVEAFSIQKLSFKDGISLVMEACADGSIRFEAKGKKAKSPVKEFELKRPVADSDFVKNPEGNFTWNIYEIIPLDDGYTLIANDKELYTSTFSDDGKLLREKRNWKSASGFYGFGQASRKANLSNQSLTIYNESKYGDHAYIFIPFYVTNESTCLYYNANGKDKIYFQDGEDSELYRSEYKRIEYFVRQDKSIKESVAKFYKESESLCLLPEWAYGYIQSKYGYKSSKEVTEVIDNFKKHKIPLSALVLDLYWFDKMGDISWTSPDFSDFEEMNKYMEDKGVKLVTITEPFYTSESKNFEELKKEGLLCKSKGGKLVLWRDWWCLNDKIGGLFNPLGKKAKKFLGEKYTSMLNSGIDGFWTDLGEPEGAKEEICYNKFKEVDFHNYYNLYWTKALWEGVHELNPEKRLFILSRSAGRGSGKYNVSIWSGDVSVSWPALKNQIAYALNTGISGLPYWGSDVGGFVNPVSPAELYLRWQQFGAFTPVYRAHGTGSREPYAFPEETKKLVTDVIKTRYKLLPYIYSTARQTMQGLPMMRGMYYESENTPDSYLDKEYMFGDSLLVSPVTQELSVSKEHKVWLPKGVWYNFFTMEKITANEDRELALNVNLATIPVYIKAAAIIPMKEDDTDILLLCPEKGKSNTFTLYKDDGESNAYKNGSYSEIIFTLDGNHLSAKTEGISDYLVKEFALIYPGKTDLKTAKRVTLEELIKGIDL